MIGGARLTVGKKTFQPIAMDHQMAPLAGNERIAFELYKKFRYPRTRSAHQVSKILMSRGNCQACSAFFFEAKILAQLEQNQRETLLECATHEVRAAQLDQIPPSLITSGHTLEVL